MKNLLIFLLATSCQERTEAVLPDSQKEQSPAANKESPEEIEQRKNKSRNEYKKKRRNKKKVCLELNQFLFPLVPSQWDVPNHNRIVGINIQIMEIEAVLSMLYTSLSLSI